MGWFPKMDQKIYEAFESALTKDLEQIIISNSSDTESISKIKIRPVLLKKELFFQASSFCGTKVLHSNYGQEELLKKLPDWFSGLFRQAEIKTLTKQVNILISKKGTVTVKTKQRMSNDPLWKSGDGLLGEGNRELIDHNRKKQYLLKEGVAIPFMVDLGIMSIDGNVIKSKYDKFRQINRYLEFIEDILPNLPKDEEIKVIDFGCGKSYLTFAMYYYLKEIKGYRIKITGLDLKEDVIKTCNDLKERYGYQELEFRKGDIKSYQGTNQVTMVVTLHACDTATDYALYKAALWGAKVVLSVPCCQHELNRQISCNDLQPVLKYGLIKERMAALMTDALRANLMETLGYKVQILEFIDMEHTPKNILIRAVRKGNQPPAKEIQRNLNQLKSTFEYLNCNLTLYQLISSTKEWTEDIEGK